MARQSTRRRIRSTLKIATALVVVALIGIFGLRQISLSDFAETKVAFEQEVGTLGPAHSETPAIRPESQQRFQQARKDFLRGHRALEASELKEAVDTVEAIESLRLELLATSPQLTDLLLAQAASRFSLDLAAATLETPEVSPALLRRLQSLFSLESDHAGVDEAIIYECEVLLAESERLAIGSGFADQIYYWARGPADKAAALRLYLGLAEAMRQPIPDISLHLRDRADTENRVVQPIAAILIPNLQSAAWSHRYQTTSRRLIRLAVSSRLSQAQTGVLPALSGLQASDLDSTVNHGETASREELADIVILSFPRAAAHQKAGPDRPNTAPPRFPLEIRLPRPS